MKKGRLVILDQIDGRECAALIDNGRLSDFLLDPKGDAPRPGAIYRAKTLRPMKGQNGVMLDLGGGHTGYLRQAKGITAGETMLVQISTYAEGSKASPVSPKLLFKSRYCIVTPDVPGLNIARKIRDEDERDRLLEVAHEALDGADESLGLIVRSVSGGVDADAIFEDITAMRTAAETVLAEPTGEPALLLEAESAAQVAWREWVDPDPDDVTQDEGGLELLGFRDSVDALLMPNAFLSGGAWMAIEPTSALVAVDVNTGPDTSFAAGLKANLAAAKDLPRQLRLRGLGGQIVVDFAPMPRKDQRQVEQALRAGFKADGIETALVGWTGLGHFELQRKRERLPLSEVLK
jgi:Ribonuclease G/E